MAKRIQPNLQSNCYQNSFSKKLPGPFMAQLCPDIVEVAARNLKYPLKRLRQQHIWLLKKQKYTEKMKFPCYINIMVTPLWSKKLENQRDLKVVEAVYNAYAEAESNDVVKGAEVSNTLRAGESSIHTNKLKSKNL